MPEAQALIRAIEKRVGGHEQEEDGQDTLRRAAELSKRGYDVSESG